MAFIFVALYEVRRTPKRFIWHSISHMLMLTSYQQVRNVELELKLFLLSKYLIHCAFSMSFTVYVSEEKWNPVHGDGDDARATHPIVRLMWGGKQGQRFWECKELPPFRFFPLWSNFKMLPSITSLSPNSTLKVLFIFKRNLGNNWSLCTIILSEVKWWYHHILQRFFSPAHWMHQNWEVKQFLGL